MFSYFCVLLLALNRGIATCGSEGSGVERRDWREIKAERIVRTGLH